MRVNFGLYGLIFCPENTNITIIRDFKKERIKVEVSDIVEDQDLAERILKALETDFLKTFTYVMSSRHFQSKPTKWVATVSVGPFEE